MEYDDDGDAAMTIMVDDTCCSCVGRKGDRVRTRL